MNSSEIDHNHVDIAISGGGYAGLTLACALAGSEGSKLTIAVVDPLDLKKKIETPDGRAFAISAGSVRMLECIGIWDKISQYSQPVNEIKITDSALESAFRPVYLQFGNNLDDNGPATCILESYHLLNALRQKARQYENLHLLSETGIRGFSVSSSRTCITLDNGQNWFTKILIAADGKKSRLRKLAGIKTVGWNYDQMGIVTTIAHSRPHNGTATQHFLPNGPFAILPLPDNRSSLVWTEKSEIAKNMLSLNDEDFLNEVRLRAGGELGAISLAGPRAGFPLDMRIAREFVADRFALIGDAAHGIHPIAGLGLNVGMRDIAALAEVIIKASRLGLDIGSQIVLEEYSRWRRFDSTLSAFTMDALNRMFSNDSVPVRYLRDIGLGIVDRSPALKKFFISEAAGLAGEPPSLLTGKPI